MRVAVLVKASPSSEAGVLPEEKMLQEMGEFNEQLIQAGLMEFGEGLKASSQGCRIAFVGADRHVIDGPFAETKELVAGFWIWKVASMEEAIAWGKRCPKPHPEDCEIEIRPLYGAEDFGDAFTPELREQEADQRARLLGLNSLKFVEQATVTLVGLQESYPPKQREEIAQQWEQFVSWLPLLSAPGCVTYGVIHPLPEGGFEYLAGVEQKRTGDVPQELTTRTLAAGRYVVFTHEGAVSELPGTLDGIWSKWVPECGLSLADADWFERYDERFDARSGQGVIEIWIPLSA